MQFQVLQSQRWLLNLPDGVALPPDDGVGVTRSAAQVRHIGEVVRLPGRAGRGCLPRSTSRNTNGPLCVASMSTPSTDFGTRVGGLLDRACSADGIERSYALSGSE